MEGKDNRSLGKRKVMKQLKNKRAQRTGGGQNTTSSSTPPVRGIADYVDSSDERFIKSEGRWGGGPAPPAQQNRRYDLDLLDDLDDVQQEQMRAADFQDLQMPTAVDGHFKFASEKNWDAAADINGDELLKNTEAGEYFTLNLKLLNAGLRTIPFYKRMDYASSMFTNNELSEMEKAAEFAEKQYQLIQAGGSNPQINITTEGGSVKSAHTNNTAADDKKEAVNDIVSATEKASLNDTTAGSTQNPPSANNDIQDWLDNVLEEGN